MEYPFSDDCFLSPAFSKSLLRTFTFSFDIWLICTVFFAKTISPSTWDCPFLLVYLLLSGWSTGFEPAIYLKGYKLRESIQFSKVISKSLVLCRMSGISFHNYNGDQLFWFISRFSFYRSLLPTADLERKCFGSVAIGISPFFLSVGTPLYLVRCSFFTSLNSLRPKSFLNHRTILIGVLLYTFVYLFLFPSDYIYSIARQFRFVNTFFQEFWIFLYFLKQSCKSNMWTHTG